MDIANSILRTGAARDLYFVQRELAEALTGNRRPEDQEMEHHSTHDSRSVDQSGEQQVGAQTQDLSKAPVVRTHSNAASPTPLPPPCGSSRTERVAIQPPG